VVAVGVLVGSVDARAVVAAAGSAGGDRHRRGVVDRADVDRHRRRAIAQTEPLARIQAISEAIECLVSGVKVPARWSDEELRTLRDALPDDLTPDLRKRARKAISDLNEVPLMPRLRHLIETRGLPVSDAEFALLKTVRRIRNDAVHGREAQPPAPEVLDHATAVLCRLTVEHLATP
jgi:hypothetical protein